MRGAALATVFLCNQALCQTSSTPNAVAAAENPAEASDTVGRFTAWVIGSGDNHGAPFIVIDKTDARVMAFDANNQLVGATPALLGIAHGDDSAPGVGTKKLSAIAVHERTTPAGRFLAHIGLETGNKEVLWVDYPNSISLHPVVTANRKERRLERLNSPTADDNRITFGCINVSAAFYKDVVRPLFKPAGGVVYILPETKALSEVFSQYPASAQAIALSDSSR